MQAVGIKLQMVVSSKGPAIYLDRPAYEDIRHLPDRASAVIQGCGIINGGVDKVYSKTETMGYRDMIQIQMIVRL